MDIINQLTTEFNLKPEHANNIVNLLDEGNTIPFIARYRKEMTGAIDDQVLRQFVDRYEYLKILLRRKRRGLPLQSSAAFNRLQTLFWRRRATPTPRRTST